VVVTIGGRGSLWGGLLAAIPFIYGTELVRSIFSKYSGLNLLLYGLFLVLVMIYYPGGIAKVYQKLIGESKNRIIRWLTGRDNPSLRI